VIDAATCIGFLRPRNALVCVCSIYAVTSNHIHLLVKDTGPEVIAQSMQLIAGRSVKKELARAQ
jgi:putative transposase